MPTTTFYPDADPESTSCDGYAGNSHVGGVSFATLRGGSGHFSDDSGSALNVILYPDASSGLWQQLNRVFIGFDRSSLPGGQTITGVNLGVYVNSAIDDFGLNLDLVAATPASDTAIVSADFSQVGTTLLATSIAISSLTAGGLTAVFALNAAGIAHVTANSISKFALRSSADTSNSAPSWDSALSEEVILAAAEDGVNISYLEVTYEAAASFNAGRAKATHGVLGSGVF